ncbi:hypothetical protein SESBI_26454 [Sesbania bispinosa]|nr:hypothetical protein SESBI_26454 [Sesbania bispinosa]
MRQKSIEEKSDTYDPICLSDIELNDEWITKKEDPCLLVDGTWMDIHESFTFEEGAPTKKRKRGICSTLHEWASWVLRPLLAQATPTSASSFWQMPSVDVQSLYVHFIGVELDASSVVLDPRL